MKPAIDRMNCPKGGIFEGEIGDENIVRVDELH